MRRAALTALALLALGLAAAAPASARTQRTTLTAVEQQVMCVTCGIPLAEAQSAAADDERAFIQSLVDKGDTLAEIKRALVAQLGPAVLALPPAHGFDATVYVVPIVAVAAAVALVAVLLPRWRRRRRTSAGTATLAEPLSPADAARLEEDLARFDRWGSVREP